MAVRRPRHVETPEAARIRDRADRARRAQPPRDPDGSAHAACCEIARLAGVDPSDVLDDWDERCAIRQWDGCTSRADAERLAVDDVRERYLKQRSMM